MTPQPRLPADRSPEALAALREQLRARAQKLNFALCGVAPAVTPTGWPRFQEWLDRGFAGEMQYLPRRKHAYQHPSHVLPPVAAVIMCGWNYRSTDVVDLPPGGGKVARYAQSGNDYHTFLRDRLKDLASVLHHYDPTARTRVVVDTAPLLERDFARIAGMGWFGKNTMLINKRAGSYLLLGGILTELPLPADDPHETAHCGTCTRCLEACPTAAFPEPGVLDARRCISYWTIEQKGAIPFELRNGFQDWLFGCDICQEVCPWNRKAPRSTDAAAQARPDLAPADAIAILNLSPAEFEQVFGSTPLSRPGWSGILRNAAIVLGNSQPPEAWETLLATAATNESAVVRGAAVWAVSQYRHPDSLTFFTERQQLESDQAVQEELRRAVEILATPEVPQRSAIFPAETFSSRCFPGL